MHLLMEGMDAVGSVLFDNAVADFQEIMQCHLHVHERSCLCVVLLWCLACDMSGAYSA